MGQAEDSRYMFFFVRTCNAGIMRGLHMTGWLRSRCTVGAVGILGG